ncbi:unnamed protein product [Orchesella dallaii]|uniref:Odorant receptor n=1 Tax=Orchesella dallaii TaxID=48710 RepID=A0ABP1PLB9_9HEXA
MTTKIVSDFTKSVITIRWKLFHFIGNSAFVDWDSNKREFTALSSSLTYMLYNATMLTYGGFIFQAVLATYLVSKSLGVEDGLHDQVVSTIVAGWVEWALLSCFIFVSWIVKQHGMEMNYLCNQVFRYCRQIEDKMCHHNLHFELEQLNYIKEIEFFVFLIGVLTTILPPAYLPFFLTENETMHEFFQDVFEVDVSLKVSHLPILLLITWAMYSCGGVAFHILSVAVIYLEFTVVCISSLMPQNLVLHRGQENSRRSEYHVQTTSFGILHETEVLQMYRTLQVFNILSNNIYASILLSAHHP